jgi:hypothetical protein
MTHRGVAEDAEIGSDFDSILGALRVFAVRMMEEG